MDYGNYAKSLLDFNPRLVCIRAGEDQGLLEKLEEFGKGLTSCVEEAGGNSTTTYIKTATLPSKADPEELLRLQPYLNSIVVHLRDDSKILNQLSYFGRDLVEETLDANEYIIKQPGIIWSRAEEAGLFGERFIFGEDSGDEDDDELQLSVFLTKEKKKDKVRLGPDNSITVYTIDSFIDEFVMGDKKNYRWTARGSSRWVAQRPSNRWLGKLRPLPVGVNTKVVSSLEVVVMMKGSLEQARRAYEFNPAALTAEVFRDICTDGCPEPGVLGYLANKLPPGTLLPDRDDDDCGPRASLPIHLVMKRGPGPDRPSEDDIIELINLCPESILEEDDDLTGFCAWDYALGGYSMKIINFMARNLVLQNTTEAYFRTYDLEFDNPQARGQIDIELVNNVAPLLSSIKIFNAWCSKWTPEAWIKCLELLLENPNFTGLDFILKFDDEGINADNWRRFFMEGALQPIAFRRLVQLASCCSIEDVEVDVDCLRAHSVPVDVIAQLQHLIFDLVSRMPKLQKLRLVKLVSTHPLSPNFRTLAGTNLTSLELEYCVGGRISRDDMVLLLEEVASSTTLTKFVLELPGERTFFLDAQNRLMEMLKTRNTTLLVARLTHAEFVFRAPGPILPKSEIKSQMIEKRIECYTKLNGCGRAKARNPMTSTSCFVGLLDAICARTGMVDRMSFLHGILRESPSLWCYHCCVDNSKQMKQKISTMTETSALPPRLPLALKEEKGFFTFGN